MRGGRGSAVAAVLVTSVLWGTTGTAATFASGVGPLAIGSAALGVGGLLQALTAIPALRAAGPALRTNRRLVALGALAVAVYPLAFYSSMHLAGVAVGTVVSLASAPLASGLLEHVRDGVRLERRWMLAAAVGVLGSVLLCLSKAADATESMPRTVLGIALGLLAGATYATYSWTAHRLMGRGLGRAASMGAVFGLGGALLVPVLLVTGGPLVASSQSFAVALYMALVPMFGGYLLFGYGLTRIAPSTATTITMTEPGVAALLAVLVVGERLTLPGWAGLLLLGLVLVLLGWRRPGDDRTGGGELVVDLSHHPAPAPLRELAHGHGARDIHPGASLHRARVGRSAGGSRVPGVTPTAQSPEVARVDPPGVVAADESLFVPACGDMAHTPRDPLPDLG